ncbi:MAG: TetR-like C-terminal domain-containing protein, partial [Oscillospiraceae bacterium]
YAHYSDPYDLLRQIVDEGLQTVARSLAEQDYNTEQPVSEQNLRKILQYAQDNADVFKAMLSENSDAAIQRELMVFINDASFPIEIPFDAKTKEFISLFSISGVVSVLNKWLQDGMQEPIEQMAAFIMQILYRGLLGVEKR